MTDTATPEQDGEREYRVGVVVKEQRTVTIDGADTAAAAKQAAEQQVLTELIDERSSITVEARAATPADSEEGW